MKTKKRAKMKIERKRNYILIYYFALLCNSVVIDILDLKIDKLYIHYNKVFLLRYYIPNKKLNILLKRLILKSYF